MGIFLELHLFGADPRDRFRILGMAAEPAVLKFKIHSYGVAVLAHWMVFE